MKGGDQVVNYFENAYREDARKCRIKAMVTNSARERMALLNRASEDEKLANRFHVFGENRRVLCKEGRVIETAAYIESTEKDE